MPSGRNSVHNPQAESAVLLQEPRSRAINLDKTAFVFIIAAQIQQKTDFYGNAYYDISDDIITVAEIIRLITDKPFVVPPDRIHRFINSDQPEAVYNWFRQAVNDPTIENIWVFYQGFTLLSAEEFLVNLRPLAGNNPAEAITLSFATISHILAGRNNLNFYLFIDSSQSARVFQQFDAPNFVVIASCSEQQESYIIESEQANKKISVFNYALIQSLKELTQQELLLSVNDLFLHLRRQMAALLARREGVPIVQTPEISTRNLAPYFRLLPADTIAAGADHPSFQSSYTYEEVHELIVNDKIDRVFEILKNSAIAEQYESELVSLRYQHKRNKAEEIIGVAEPAYYQRMRSKLIVNLTSFLQQIKVDHPLITMR